MKTTIYSTLLALSAFVSCLGQPMTVVVPQAPPPVRVETRTVSPGVGYVWTPGYWRWSGIEYVWVPGTWIARPRPAAVWVAGHWVRRPGGWVWISGHWR